MALTNSQISRLRRTDPNTRLRTARHLCKLTQVELSKAVGITQATLSQLESRRWDDPRLDTARKLAGYFGCSIEDLFPAPATAVAS